MVGDNLSVSEVSIKEFNECRNALRGVCSYDFAIAAAADALICRVFRVGYLMAIKKIMRIAKESKVDVADKL